MRDVRGNGSCFLVISGEMAQRLSIEIGKALKLQGVDTAQSAFNIS